MRKIFKNLTDDKLFTTTSFIHGEVLPVTQVPLESFSKKKWEDGYGILPSGKDGNIYAPLDGIVMEIGINRNMYRISGENGLDIAIHLGIDTDDTTMSYFNSMCHLGQKVKTGDVIGTMDVKKITDMHKCPISYLLFISGEEVRLIKHHSIVDQHDNGFFLCAQTDKLL